MAKSNEDKANTERYFALGKLVLGDHAHLRPARTDVIALGQYAAGEVDVEPSWLPTIPLEVARAVGFQRAEVVRKRAEPAIEASTPVEPSDAATRDQSPNQNKTPVGGDTSA